MAYLTPTQFYAYSGLTPAQINTNYLNLVLDTISDAIDEQVGDLFILENTTRLYYGTKSGIRNVEIEVWQKQGLVVKLGRVGDSNLETLVLNTDYFITSPQRGGGKDVAIIINLTCDYLYSRDYLQIEGNKGWSNGLPPSLQIAFYSAIKDLVNLNQATQLTPLASSEKSINLSVSYDSKYLAQLKALERGDLFADPNIANLLGYYKGLLTKNYESY